MRTLNESQEVRVGSPGVKGDEVTCCGGKKIFIPYTLPGDITRISITKSKRAQLIELMALVE